MLHIQINGTIVDFSENWTFKADVDFQFTSHVWCHLISFYHLCIFFSSLFCFNAQILLKQFKHIYVYLIVCKANAQSGVGHYNIFPLLGMNFNLFEFEHKKVASQIGFRNDLPYQSHEILGIPLFLHLWRRMLHCTHICVLVKVQAVVSFVCYRLDRTF